MLSNKRVSTFLLYFEKLEDEIFIQCPVWKISSIFVNKEST